MMRKINILFILVLFAALGFSANLQAEDDKVMSDGDKNAAKKEEAPLIQIAILLDTSKSMDDLIHQAQNGLWDIVNKFATAKYKGKTPRMEVALYQYGVLALGAENKATIVKVQEFTADLDKVFEQLMSLKTSGEKEYCGQVIKIAGEDLKWSKSSRDYKAIFIAGNEKFTQGTVNYKTACRDVRLNDIVVNTILYGEPDPDWEQAAVMTGGMHKAINSKLTAKFARAPQDKLLAKLGRELNRTYIPFGKQAEGRALRQEEMDKKAFKLGETIMAHRAITKVSHFYRNEDWDLVDATENDSSRIKDIKAEDLPLEMQKMTESERKAFVESKFLERKGIKDQITKLNEQRNKFLENKAQIKTLKSAKTLDQSMKIMIREQLKARKYKFD